MAIDITGAKQLEQQLRQAQRMETIGRLAGEVACDFNIIGGFYDLLMEDSKIEEGGLGRLEHVSRAADRAVALTHQLLAFSRQQILQPRVSQLSELLEESTKMLQRLIGEHIEMKILNAPCLGKVKADPGQIEQVILNLAVNARDAMPTGATLTIETADAELTWSFCERHAGARLGQYVMFRVTDTGTGMDEETLAHIFEPFYTTKELGKGTGLGLSMVYGIVKQSNGYIQVESGLGLGTTFQVYLPRVDAAAAERDVGGKTSKNGESGNKTVLVVEDDEGVRELTREVLAARGYSAMAASRPREALELSTKQEVPIDLAITDVIMPGMSGREMAGRIAEARPGLRILMMSGYAEPQIGHILIADHRTSFLQKPFTPGTLANVVREILDQGRN